LPDDFDDVLVKLRDSELQVELQSRSNACFLKAAAFISGFGLFLVAGVLAGALGGGWIAATILIALSIACLVKAARLQLTTLLIAKEQDRRYFLESLRAATTTEELNKAGLFAYFKTAYGDAWVRDASATIKQLDTAVAEKPDWYEPPKE
jgi:hypothetical protein